MPHLWGVEAPYPRPRPDRGAPPVAQVIAPTAREITLLVATGGPNLRATAVSAGIVGPALLTRGSISGNLPQSATRMSGVELYWSEDNGGEGNAQAISAVPSGFPVFEAVGDPNTRARFQTRRFFRNSPLFTTSFSVQPFELRYLVTATLFFLKCSVVSDDSAAVAEVSLRVEVLEGVDPQVFLDLY